MVHIKKLATEKMRIKYLFLICVTLTARRKSSEKRRFLQFDAQKPRQSIAQANDRRSWICVLPFLIFF